jgi:hypothetical protein
MSAGATASGLKRLSALIIMPLAVRVSDLESPRLPLQHWQCDWQTVAVVFGTVAHTGTRRLPHTLAYYVFPGTAASDWQ